MTSNSNRTTAMTTSPSDQITIMGAGFVPGDVGKTLLLLTVPWYKRLWHWIKTRIFRIKEDHPGIFIITDVKTSTQIVVEPAYRCVSCKQYVPWDFGCADDLPFHCDDCWQEKNDAPIPRSSPSG